MTTDDNRVNHPQSQHNSPKKFSALTGLEIVKNYPGECNFKKHLQNNNTNGLLIPNQTVSTNILLTNPQK